MKFYKCSSRTDSLNDFVKKDDLYNFFIISKEYYLY